MFARMRSINRLYILTPHLYNFFTLCIVSTQKYDRPSKYTPLALSGEYETVQKICEPGSTRELWA